MFRFYAADVVRVDFRPSGSQPAEASGAVIRAVGAVSSMTISCSTVVELRARSVATTSILCAPSARSSRVSAAVVGHAGFEGVAVQGPGRTRLVDESGRQLVGDHRLQRRPRTPVLQAQGVLEEIALADLKGKNIVLYFYPKDSTPGCTTEGGDFRDVAEVGDHRPALARALAFAGGVQPPGPVTAPLAAGFAAAKGYDKYREMGGIVEEQLQLAVRALVEGNVDMAAEVVHNDYRINALDVDIDEECTRIVARRQPAASDLRLVMAVIKTITDLERIGDEAKRIARMAKEDHSGVLSQDIRHEMRHMGELVSEMLRTILDAFARMDVETAVKVVESDTRVDNKYVSITRQLITYMAQDPKMIPQILNILWAARALERIGDRCENIAEYIFYLVKGRDLRHLSKVDELAEMAAAAKSDK